MRKSRRIFLEWKVAELEILITSNCDDQVHKEYNQYKMELETLYDYRTAGLILRSKTGWYEHVEESTKYFLKNKAKSQLRKIIIDSDTEISDPTAIIRHVKHFYFHFCTNVVVLETKMSARIPEWHQPTEA